MKAMILAAGLGKRMRPLTLHTPKPLLTAGGKTLIAHHLERLSAAGFKDIVINTAHLGEQIETALGNGKDFGVRIQYSPEQEALETAGGIINALPLLGEQPFLIVNGDVWCDFPFQDAPAVGTMLDKTHLAHLILVNNPAHHPAGDFIIAAQESLHGLPKLVKAGKAPAYTYSGISVLHPALFATSQPGKQALGPLLRAAIANGTVSGDYYPGLWFDIGTPERLTALDQLLSVD